MAPYEVLVQATISDLYFVHERATRLAAWNLFLLCGIAGAGFVSGYIIEDLGYEWTFGICAILFGVFGIGVVLYAPETTYIRPPVDLDATVTSKGLQNGVEHEKTDHKAWEMEHREVSSVLSGNGTSPDAASEAKMSFWRSLRLYTGRYTDAATWKIFARPLIMFVSILQCASGRN